MKKEDREFLKELQNEMNTQDTCCQANPRFWVVMQTVRDYWQDEDNDTDGICIHDSDVCESVYEGEFEGVAEWIKEHSDDVLNVEVDNGWIEIEYKDGNEDLLSDLSDLRRWFEDNGYKSHYISCYKDREEIAKDTFFLTRRECQEHIERNSYHYNKPHPYAMTAWRSPQVERLYKILQETDWNESEVE